VFSEAIDVITRAEFSKRPSVKVLVPEIEESKVVVSSTMTEKRIESPAQIHILAVKRDFRVGSAKKLVRKALEHVKAI
jgi:hypothetical protein